MNPVPLVKPSRFERSLHHLLLSKRVYREGECLWLVWLLWERQGWSSHSLQNLRTEAYRDINTWLGMPFMNNLQMNIIRLLKKWSSQNRTSQTGSYTYEVWVLQFTREQWPLLCVALIWCLSKLSLVTTLAVPVLHVCCIAHSWLPQGTILVNSCNSGDKCNCQNNKSFFPVLSVPWPDYLKPPLLLKIWFLIFSLPPPPSSHCNQQSCMQTSVCFMETRKSLKN